MKMPAVCQRVNARHTVSDLAHLTALIAALGSDQNANWWNCSFLSQQGLDSLVYNFPRTSVSAAISSTCKAASQIHDTATGAVDVYHLFRLPSSMMSQLQRSLVTESSGLREVLLDKNRCLEGVRELSGGQSVSDLGPGARNLGQFEPSDTSLAPLLAASYFEAFNNNYKTFPFFTFG